MYRSITTWSDTESQPFEYCVFGLVIGPLFAFGVAKTLAAGLHHYLSLRLKTARLFLLPCVYPHMHVFID